MKVPGYPRFVTASQAILMLNTPPSWSTEAVRPAQFLKDEREFLTCLLHQRKSAP